MAAHNRYIRGNKTKVYMPVAGAVVVSAGDFMSQNTTAGMCSIGGALKGVPIDNYAYPFSYVYNTATAHTTAQANAYEQFIGIAMESSPAGVTEHIAIYTDGIFRYPLYYPGTAVTIGSRVSMTTVPQSGIGASNQTVVVGNTGTVEGSTGYLGWIIKTESGASFVDFQLNSQKIGTRSI